MIDLHCHLLPGVDDGAQTMHDALEMAYVHLQRGVATVACTPHVNWETDLDSNQIALGVQQLRLELANANLPLEIVTGAEVALTKAVELSDDELNRLKLNCGSWLLVEPPHASAGSGVEALLGSLMNRGHQLIIAHPERCAAFATDPASLGRLVAAGALAQITAASLDGRFGPPAKKISRQMLELGICHLVASDAHNLDRRPPGLVGEFLQGCPSYLTQALTNEVPYSILAGGEIPVVPAYLPEAGLKRRFGGLFSGR